MMVTAPGCLYVSTHPAEPHVVAALLQLQGLQQLLNCLEATEKQSVEKSTVGRYINLLYDNFWCRDMLRPGSISVNSSLMWNILALKRLREERKLT